MLKSMSFNRKVLSLVVTVNLALAACFAVTFVNYYNTISISKRESVEKVAGDILDKIDRNLFERYGDVQAYAVSEPARAMDKTRIVAFMNDMMPTYAPIYDLMYVVDTKGDVVAVNSVDRDGKPLDTSHLYGKNFADRTWFKEAMTNIKPGTAWVDDLHIDSDVARIWGTPGHVMNYTSPIRSPADGRILGVWTNRVNWNNVIGQITNETIADATNEHLTEITPTLQDKNGMFLLHPDAERFVLKVTDPEFKEKITHISGTGKAHHQKKEFNIGKIENEVAYEASVKSKGYASYPGVGWIASVKATAHDPSVQLLWIMTAVAAAVSISLFLLSLFVVRGLSKQISTLVEAVDSESVELDKSSVLLNTTSNSLAEAATEQSASIQETASSIEEISSMVTRSADSAQKSMQTVSRSNESAMRGKRTIEEMVSSMTDISTANANIMKQVEASNQRLAEITKVIAGISSKTKVINDIVFQTKLLSFNASVEAARAGEHGKGFAVVAEEVGNLAQMSGNASKEIARMLDESAETVNTIVNETKGAVDKLVREGQQKIERGTQIAKQCGDVLEEIVGNETEVKTMVGEISVASQEQAQGVAEINKAIAQLDQVTHQNAKIASETAGFSNTITDKSARLKKVVTELRGIIYGRNAKSKSDVKKFTDMTGGNAPALEPLVPTTESRGAEVLPFGRKAVKIANDGPEVKSVAAMKTTDQTVPKGTDPRFVDL